MLVALAEEEVGEVLHGDHVDNHEAPPAEGVVEDEVLDGILLIFLYIHTLDL